MSWIGPVFDFELLTTARRARYYALRFLYVAILLFMVFCVYQSYAWRPGTDSREMSIDEMSNFANATFTSFGFIQFFAVIFLTPALVAGTIADEKQRKTLHYLLSSRLTGAEIVLGKLGSRLLNVLVIMGAGLPIVSLMTLFGGIDPLVILATYAETFMAVYFLAALSIWVSVQSKKPREAVSLMYLFAAVWLIGFQIVLITMPTADEPIRTIWEYVQPYYEWVAMCSPGYLLNPRRFMTANGIAVTLPWIIGSQFVYGTFFILLAILQLRRVYARQDDTSGKLLKLRKAILGKRSWLPRPACGDDAMLWKEFFVSKTGGLSKITGLLLSLSIVGLIVYSGYDIVRDAARELLAYGFTGMTTSARNDLSLFIRGVTTPLYVLWLLGICASAASGIASEREEDTWITLISTPLEKIDILRPKFLAPFWAMKPVLLMILALWIIGLALGGLHPIGFILGALTFSIFSAFFAALGLSFSLALKNSTRAQASTLLTMIVLSGGYLFCCIPFQWDGPYFFALCTPFAFFCSQMSWDDFWFIFGRTPNGSNNYGYHRFGDVVVTAILCVAIYGVAAYFAIERLNSFFDRAVGRPDRLTQADDLTPAQIAARRQALLELRARNQATDQPAEGIDFLDEPGIA